MNANFLSFAKAFVVSIMSTAADTATAINIVSNDFDIILGCYVKII